MNQTFASLKKIAPITKIFSESRYIKPNLNYKYSFPISIWHQAESRLEPNESEKCDYNPSLV